MVYADIYWKNEHRLLCSSEVCTTTERDRHEKSVSSSMKHFNYDLWYWDWSECWFILVHICLLWWRL